MDYRFFAPWDQVLPRERGHVVAFAGGTAAADLADAAAAVYGGEGVPFIRCGPGDPDPGDEAVVLAAVDGPEAVPGEGPGRAGTWPARTSLAVLVLPVDGVGGRADAFWSGEDRPPGVDPWTVVTWELLDAPALAAVASVPAGVPVVLALAGLEDQPDSIGLFAFTGRMMEQPRLAVVLFCSAGPGGPTVRACCRADDG